MKLNDLKNELNSEKQLTENVAVGYRTTGKELLDLNFMTSSLRNMDESDIYNKFVKAFYENKLLAVKWLYFLRDIRGGMGERRSFRVILQCLAHDHPKLVKEFIGITAEYGRYDDLWCLLDTDLRDDVIKYCYLILLKDIKNAREGKPITLLGKWLPSLKSAKEDSARYAKIFAKGFNLGKTSYQKTLKMLREYSNVVECKMSTGRWNEIDYSTVPSKANIIYRNAFYKHDEERRRAYLDSLSKGETKINGGVNFPHDIVHNYTVSDWYSYTLKPYDESLEQIWKALPNYVNGDESTIVVKDGSGSMGCTIGETKVTAMEVADALAIYFAEKCHGEYKNKFITFSSSPKLVDMSKCNSLREKLEVTKGYNEVSNTNIEAVFDLILKVAVKNKYSQDELPKNILILSDMEFDSCACDNSCVSSWHVGFKDTLFEKIAKKYDKYGYKMPRMVFWNLMSRTGSIPVKENNLGVALVSGFSPTVIKMVLSNKLDPYECLLDQLNSERYDLVEEAFNKVN